jgi:hypothetical protein
MKKPKSHKRGARYIRKRPRSKRQSWRVASRHSYGRSEKILRRNRKLWVRLHAKEGRQLDKLAIKEEFSASGSS